MALVERCQKASPTWDVDYIVGKSFCGAKTFADDTVDSTGEKSYREMRQAR